MKHDDQQASTNKIPATLTCLRFDSEGRGVCTQENGKIIFVEGMVPGDIGLVQTQEIFKNFDLGLLLKREKSSPERITPSCEHFENCGGCQFLNIPYAMELEHKKSNLQSLVQKMLKIPLNFPFNVIPAPTREGYRNRIQLHYNEKQVGMVHKNKKELIDQKNCLVADPQIQQFIQQNATQAWPILKNEKLKQGHIEIAVHPSGVSIAKNKAYAHDGFSQVYPAMNEQLLEYLNHNVYKHLDKNIPWNCFDLFGGNGNLSFFPQFKHAFVYEAFLSKTTRQQPPTTFIKSDLFRESHYALKQLKLKNIHQQNNILVIDPPRSGFQQLADWVKVIAPSEIIYISCKADTCFRDIAKIFSTQSGRYKISEIALFDFFPGTKHYETFVHIKKIK
jgi:23S rRNA (uracil1939-C5)-methyltransferase